MDICEDLATSEIEKHFNHAEKKHMDARMAEDYENTIYWQGRKDAIRILRAVMLSGLHGKGEEIASLENERHYSSPNWEGKEND